MKIDLLQSHFLLLNHLLLLDLILGELLESSQEVAEHSLGPRRSLGVALCLLQCLFSALSVNIYYPAQIGAN